MADQTPLQISKNLVIQYVEALNAWTNAVAQHQAGNRPAALEFATDAEKRLSYLSRSFPVTGTDYPHPDVTIALHGLAAWVNPDVTNVFTTEELEALWATVRYTGTLYSSGAPIFLDKYKYPVERPFSYAQWTETMSRFPVIEAPDIRAALALRRVETRDFRGARELLGEFDPNKSPFIVSVYLLLLEQSGRWDALIPAAQAVNAKYNHVRTANVDPNSREAFEHGVKLTTWSLAMYLMAYAHASLGEYEAAATLFNEVERLDGLPALTALSSYRHAQMALVQGQQAVSDAKLAQSLRMHATPRAQRALSAGLTPLRVTSQELIRQRTDVWDPDTEPDPVVERRQKLRSDQSKMEEKAASLLTNIVGLDDLKEQMEELKFAVAEEAVRTERGLSTRRRNFNSMLLGHPGTGKTTITEVMALTFCAHGMVDYPDPVVLFKADVVAGYMGQTADKATAAVTSNVGRFILFDEAYSWVEDSKNGGSDMMGIEAVSTVVGLSETLYPKNTIMSMAGYPRKMQDFLEVNPGMGGRFPMRYLFASYTNPQLLEIFKIRAKENDRILTPEVSELFVTGGEFNVLQREVEPGTLFVDKLNNARFIRDLDDQASIIASARRGRTGATASTLSNDELNEITAEDVVKAFNRLVGPKRYLLSS